MSEDLREPYLQLLKLTLTGVGEARPNRARIRDDGVVEAVPLGDLDARVEGRDWPPNGLTMVGLKRLDNVRACIEQVLADGVPGDLVETGVWRGGTWMYIDYREANGIEDEIHRIEWTGAYWRKS